MINKPSLLSDAIAGGEMSSLKFHQLDSVFLLPFDPVFLDLC